MTEIQKTKRYDLEDRKLKGVRYGYGQVGLAWLPPASNGSAITNYKVYRGTVTGEESLLLTLGNITITSYTDLVSSAGTTYYFKVTAVNAVGESSFSSANEVTAWCEWD
jgi:fibronectin type 3 domain-containing protein